MPLRDHVGSAARAAAMARAASSALARVNAPTMSPVFDGLTLSVASAPPTQSPAM